MEAMRGTAPTDRGSRNIAALIAIVFLAYLVLGWLIDQHRNPITYYVSQWMVTYRAGFIRRGILGQTVWDVSHLFRISPVAIIKGCQYGLAVALSAVIGVQCYVQRSRLGIVGIVLLLVNPFLNKYLWLETGSLDTVFVLLPIFNLWLSLSSPETYAVRATWAFATAGVYVALSHEAFLFLCLPVNLWITWQHFAGAGRVAAAKRCVQIYAAPVAACIVESFFHGTDRQARLIEQAWRAEGVAIPHGSAISYMGFSFRHELEFVRAVPHLDTFVVWCFATLLCFLPLAWMSNKLVAVESRREFGLLCKGFLWGPIACSLPMYLIGSDWDRWPAIPVITGTLCILMVASRRLILRPIHRFSLPAVALLVTSLLIRPIPPNVHLDQAFTGPVVGGRIAILHPPTRL